MPAPLGQVLALVKGAKQTAHDTTTKVGRILQNSGLFAGQIREYAPIIDGATQHPAESQRVQMNVEDVLADYTAGHARLYDLILMQDCADQDARGSVLIEGGPQLTDLPVTYLLFLDKQLSELASLVRNLPVLDPTVTWELDPNTGTYRTQEMKTARTEKVPQVIVKYEATDKHPAQTEMITLDRTAGYWTTRKLSGALPQPRRDGILARIKDVQDLVRVAREQANQTGVTNRRIGEDLLTWLFAA